MRSWLIKHRIAAAFTVVIGLHLLMVWHYAPPDVIFGDEPIYAIDYPLHYHQVDRAVKAFNGWGKLWGYDPLMLAGHPMGALEDISSKSIELWVIALTKFGVKRSVAFNLYPLLIHLLFPLFAIIAARVWQLRPGESLVVLILWVGLWFLDSFTHWLWYCGMISWAAVSCLSIILIGLVYRAFEDNRLRWWIPIGLLASLLALMHPFAALTLIGPCAALFLRGIRRRPWSVHVSMLGAVLAAVATALIWLIPALSMIHYMLPDESFLRPTISFIFWDWVDVVKNAFQTGAPVRTMVRFLAFVAGAICLFRWWRIRDRRALPLTVLILICLGFSYGGGHIFALRLSQPFRQMAPAVLGAAIPAGVLLAYLLSWRRLRALSNNAKTLLLLALVLLMPRLIRNVLYYAPDALPWNQKAKDFTAYKGWPSPMVGFAEPRPKSFRHRRPPKWAPAMRRWLESNLHGQGRILCTEYLLTEYLAATSKLPLLGGLRQRTFAQGDAHLFRLDPDGDLPGDGLRKYLERYAVRFVVVAEINKHLEWRKDLLKFRHRIGGVRIYETLIEPNYLMQGQGRIIDQDLNKIAVADAQGDVVIRFHWMETLRCRPNCEVERAPVDGDRVGFIRVRNAPPRFEIYNSYVMRGPKWHPGMPGASLSKVDASKGQ